MPVDLHKYLADRGKYEESVSIAILTSGGDAPGMNACLRACVRMAIYLGCKPYFVFDGFQGLVNGDEFIRPAEWSSVSNIIHMGGTVIGSARCLEFHERATRKMAVKNMVKNGISNLVVIGGDGSLTGAATLRKEWPEWVEELLKDGAITQEERDKCRHLRIVGVVATIDNDFYGTAMTLGTSSALHRITEAIDSILSTAASHKRTFILELMGRRCGYLTISSALANEVDYVFIPEYPAAPDWRDNLCFSLQQEAKKGARAQMVLVAEGAVDTDGNHIRTEEIRKVIVERLKHNTRVSVLGHLQRGGSSSAFDRILGCRLGAEAILALMDATDKSEAEVVLYANGRIKRESLMECVEKTAEINDAAKAKDFKLVRELRSHSFRSSLKLYRTLKFMDQSVKKDSDDTAVRETAEKPTPYRLAVMHLGSPACGMNAAVRSFVRHCILSGLTPLGVTNGFGGLVKGKVREMKWSDVIGWAHQGGSLLGTRLELPMGMHKEIADRIKEFNIQGLFLIGGFEAFRSLNFFQEQRKNYPEFCIPLLLLPATISNNVPGTDFSLGSDTSLNEIISVIDRIRQSAQSTKTRCFVVETTGGYCGYLATMAGLACCADAIYINEQKFTIKDLIEDVHNIIIKVKQGSLQRGTVIRSQFASANYSSDFIHRLYAEEGHPLFTTRMNQLGHFQEGGSPSPFDRNMATKMGGISVDWFVDKFNENPADSNGTVCFTDNESVCVCGLVKDLFKFTPLSELVPKTDFVHRRPIDQWWLRLKPLLKFLNLPQKKMKTKALKKQFVLPYLFINWCMGSFFTKAEKVTESLPFDCPCLNRDASTFSKFLKNCCTNFSHFGRQF